MDKKKRVVLKKHRKNQERLKRKRQELAAKFMKITDSQQVLEEKSISEKETKKTKSKSKPKARPKTKPKPKGKIPTEAAAEKKAKPKAKSVSKTKSGAKKKK